MIVAISSTTPFEFGSRRFPAPVIIKGTLNHITPSLMEKEQEQDLIEGKVALFLVYFMLIDI